MAKQDFKIRFDQARARLNNALKDLDKTAIEKLHETASQSRMLHVLGDENSLNAKVTEQNLTIQNLISEINKLQEGLAALGNENDVLIEENKVLSEDLEKLKEEGMMLVEAIELDLVQIEEIITGEKK